MKVFIAHENKTLCKRYISHINATGMANVTKDEVFEKLTGKGGCEDAIKKCQPEILFLGLWFEENVEGFMFCKKMKGLYPAMKIILIVTREDNEDFKDEINEAGMNNGYVSEKANEEVIKSAMTTLAAGNFFQYYKYTADGEPLNNLTVDPQWHILASNTNNLNSNDPKKIPHYLQLVEALENNILDIIQKNPDLYRSFKKNVNDILFIRNYNDWMISQLLNLENNSVTQERSKFILNSKRLSSVLHLQSGSGTTIISEQEKDWILKLAAGYSSKETAKTEEVSLEDFNKKRQRLINRFGGNIFEMIYKCLENKIITYEEINATRENNLKSTNKNK